MQHELTLSRRAGLTFVSTILQQGAQFLVAFLVTPVVVRWLGAELYGAWAMIQQLVGYLSLGDLRPMGTLKFTLAISQHKPDLDEKKRQIGAALLLWLVTFPLLLSLGGILIWYAPSIIRTSPSSVTAVQIALAVVVLSVALDRLVSLPANVMRGQNLDYKFMGLNAAMIIAGGLITIAFVTSGFGLPGVAFATTLSVVLTGAVRYVVMRRVLPWISWTKPRKDEFISFTKLSAWLFFSALSSLLINSSDILVAGMMLGTSSAAVYATTSAVLRVSSNGIGQLLSAGMPGLAGLCGAGEWERVRNVRLELHQLGMVIATVLSVGVLLLNESFLGLWVGPGYFGGQALNLILVFSVAIALLNRIDGGIVDSVLAFKEKATAQCLSGILAISVGLILSRPYGLVGVALGGLAGQLLLSIVLFLLMQRRARINTIEHLRSQSVTLTVFFIGSILAGMMGQIGNGRTWFSFFLFAFCIGVSTGLVSFFVGLRRPYRERMAERVRSAFLRGI